MNFFKTNLRNYTVLKSYLKFYQRDRQKEKELSSKYIREAQCSFLQALLTTYMVFIIVLFLIAVLVVNTCREFELLHLAQGATAHKGPLHRS